MNAKKLIAMAACTLSVGVTAIGVTGALASDETTAGAMSTAKTQDVVNTLRERGSFHKMLDGLEQSFDLDNELKGKGPYTVFAADDKAWGKMNQADTDTLFGNKNKLAQVLRYEVIKGQCLDSDQLKSMGSVQSLEGKMIKISCKDGDKKDTSELWVNNSKVKTADIKCSNGIIHIVDAPLMPKLVE